MDNSARCCSASGDRPHPAKYTQPEMATDMFGSTPEKLGLIWSRGRDFCTRAGAAAARVLAEEDSVAIAERQLETWAQQGKTGQFTDTYKSIRGNLLDASAPYPVKNVDVLLQGSYGNNTNVWADSDVDIVLKHTGAFYYDISEMSRRSKSLQGRVLQECGTATRSSSRCRSLITRLYNGVAARQEGDRRAEEQQPPKRGHPSLQQFRRYTRTSSASAGIMRAWRSTQRQPHRKLP